MKKFFAAAVMILASLTASAQTPERGEISLTPMVGISGGGFIGHEYKGMGNTPSRDGNVGFTAGAELGIMVGSKFKTSVGLQYINTSTQLKYEGGEKGDFKNDYLAIPILANVYVADGFAIKAGVQPAFLLSSKAESVDRKDHLNSFDFTIPVGLSYEYMNVVLDARYNIGVTNIVKDENKSIGGFTKLNNGYFTITVGYKLKLK